MKQLQCGDIVKIIEELKSRGEERASSLIADRYNKGFKDDGIACDRARTKRFHGKTFNGSSNKYREDLKTSENARNDDEFTNDYDYSEQECRISGSQDQLDKIHEQICQAKNALGKTTVQSVVERMLDKKDYRGMITSCEYEDNILVIKAVSKTYEMSALASAIGYIHKDVNIDIAIE